MTDTTIQPGDGLPPSEPTSDIGAEPMVMSAPYLDSSRMYDMHEVAYMDYIQYKSDASALNWPEINYTQWLEWDRAMRQAQVGGVTVRVHNAEAERDALAAQLARMQAVIDGLPSECPSIESFAYPSEMGNYGRAYGKYEVRQQLEAARKGEVE